MNKKILAGMFAIAFVALGVGHSAVERETGPSSVAQDNNAISQNSTYYTMRPDLRRCASPMCGGYWIKRVNQLKIRCVDGALKEECYVAEVDLSAVGTGADAQDKNTSVFRGSIEKKIYKTSRVFGLLKVTELWIRQDSRPPTGRFFRLHDNGIRCITNPCFSIDALELNSRASEKISGVNLDQASASDELKQAARRAISDNSLLTAGVTELKPNEGPAGTGKQFVASQLYLKFIPKTEEKIEEKQEEKREEKREELVNCLKTGCSSGEACKHCYGYYQCIPWKASCGDRK